MPYPSVVQQAFDQWAEKSGLTKRSGSWYRSSLEVVSISNLQKSQYSVRYYVNQAFYLRQLGDALFPRENIGHIRLRLGSLVPSNERLEQLLDLETAIEDDARNAELRAILADFLSPIIDQGLSVSGLRDLTTQKSALVTGPAQELLAHQA